MEGNATEAKSVVSDEKREESAGQRRGRERKGKSRRKNAVIEKVYKQLSQTQARNPDPETQKKPCFVPTVLGAGKAHAHTKHNHTPPPPP